MPIEFGSTKGAHLISAFRAFVHDNGMPGIREGHRVRSCSVHKSTPTHVGATDKYDPRTSHPAFPEGYADPEKVPLLPQQFAELMAGRIATSETECQMPLSLHQTVIALKTAREIGWFQ